MKKPKASRSSCLSYIFMNTIDAAFKFLSVAFIMMNYVVLMVNRLSGNNSGSENISILTISTFIAVIMILFVEPVIYRKNKNLNVAVNVIISLCCGMLFFTHKTYLILAVFFTGMVTVSLRLSVLKSVIIAIIYYGAYMSAMMYGSTPGIDTVFLGVQVLIVLLSTIYLCRYLLKVEGGKVVQEDAVADLLNEKVRLARELSNKCDELDQSYWDMVNTLIGVIEARDNFTGGHSVKVCEYSVKLAKKIGLDDRDMSKVMKASILHDIGKMGIPDNILLKPGALSGDEYGTIMTHPEIGCKILTKVKGLEDVLPMILYHHERVDGTGYPYGLEGKSIPLGARIIAIADAYDAMTSNRPYRKALVKKEARRRLMEGAGTQFDTEYVKRFMEVIDSDNVEEISDYRRVNLEKIKDYAGII